MLLQSKRFADNLARLRRGRDPSFPRPRQIGSEFSIGWLRGEVMEWLNSQPRAEFNGLDAVERRRRARGSGAAV
ncbi:MAG: AlpA family phage regulatory protein [Burkholderiales bacterium]